MSPFGIVALVASLGIVGYAAYDVYQTQQSNSGLGGLAKKGSATASDLAKTGLLGAAGLAYEYGGSAFKKAESAVDSSAHTVANWVEQYL